MKIHFLGTSAGVPSLRRGLPAVAVEREGELLLFDCGEGTQTALQRSAARASRIVGIFISHMHGDHVMGLPGLLMSLQMAGRTEPLSLFGTPGIREFVTGTLRLVGARLGYDLHVEEVREGGVLFRASEYDVVADRLEHGVPCYGFALWEHNRPGRFDLETAQALGIPSGPLFGQLQRGETVTLDDGREVRPDEVLGPPRRGCRIAYVTDTRPCDAAIRLGADADLLIHEATFDAERGAEAASKGHSTSGEAAEAARAAGARALVLTHVSPRYDRTEELLAGAKSRFPNAWVAEDGMEVELNRDGAVTGVTGGRGRR